MERFSLTLVAMLMCALCFQAGVAIAQEGDEGPRLPKEPGERDVPPLSEDEMQEIIKFCEKYAPERLEKITQMKREKPEMLTRVLRQYLQEIRELTELRETDTEKFKRVLEERMRGGEGEKDKFPREKGRFEKMKKELNEAETEEVLSWIRVFDSVRFAKLDTVKAEDPQEYQRLLAMNYAEMMRAKETAQRDPEEYQLLMNMVKSRNLEMETKDLVDKYRKESNEETKKALRKQLTLKVNEQFDIRHGERESKIKRLEEELSKLRDNLQKRKTSKHEIVENHLKEILGEKEGMEW